MPPSRAESLGSGQVVRLDSRLRSCEVFAALDAGALTRLSESSGRHRYDRRQVVFQQGDEGDCMYVVASGSVEISVNDFDGGETVLAVLESPAAFGEMAVIDAGPRVARATAREPTELIRIPRSAVLHLLATEPSVGAALMASLVRLVRKADEQVSDLTLRQLPDRVRRHLLAVVLRQLGSPGTPPEGVVTVNLLIDQTDLARQVGGSRQQVNRALAALDAAGAIRRQGRRIVAVRLELLATGD